MSSKVSSSKKSLPSVTSFRVDRYSRMFSTTPGSPIFLLIFSKYSDRFLSRFVSSSFSQ